MNKLLVFDFFLFVAIANNVYAGTDMQCVQDCTSRGYQYQLCMQRCSFGGDDYSLPMQAPIGLSPSDTQIPMRGIPAPVPAQNVQPFEPVDIQANQLKALQMEVQRQQLEKQLMENQRQQRPADQPAAVGGGAIVRPLYNSSAEWVKFSTDNGNIGYADTATIRNNGEMVTVWWISDFKPAVKLPGKPPLVSVENQDEYDCKDMRYRRLASTVYTGHMGSGNVIKDFSEAQKWEVIHPGKMSLNEALRNYVCGRNAQPTTAATASESSQPKSSVASRLSELNKLLQDGLITQKEFDEKKQEILKAL